MGERPALNSPRTQSRSRLSINQFQKSYRETSDDLLFLVTVDSKGGPTILTKVFRNIISYSLRAHENENLGVLAADLIEMLDEFTTLFKVRAYLDNLLYVMVCSEFHGTDVDLDEIVKKILEMITVKNEIPRRKSGSILRMLVSGHL